MESKTGSVLADYQNHGDKMTILTTLLRYFTGAVIWDF